MSSGWPMALLSDDKVRGLTVIAADGQAIGEVDALSVDTTAWTIVGLRIKLRKAAAEQIGASRGLLHGATLDIPVHVVFSLGDAVLLSVPILGLRETLQDAAEQPRINKQTT